MRTRTRVTDKQARPHCLQGSLAKSCGKRCMFLVPCSSRSVTPKRGSKGGEVGHVLKAEGKG